MWTTDEYEGGEYEGEGFLGDILGAVTGETYGEMPLNEAMEMELAAELLGVTNETELEQFLGGLFKKVGGFMKSGVGKALGGVLKGIAKKALPIVGGALGSFIAPGVGTAIGSSLGSMAGKAFGLELEGLSGEDREFEVARRYVRLATTAAQKAALAPANMSPYVAARKAVILAARRHAPGLLTTLVGRPATVAGPGFTMAGDQPYGYAPCPGGYVAGQESAGGRWVRRGNAIILYGV
jgi:uncharacterized protein (DUF697 family)